MVGCLLEVEMAGCLLEVEMVGCLLEVEMVGCLLEVEIVGVLLLLGWLLRVRCEFEVLPEELLVVILLPILDVMPELMRPLELSTGRLTVLLGWLLRVCCEFEVLPEELLVVILLPILDVMLELIRPLELSTGRLTVLRVDELDFDELGRVVSCRPSVLELGAVGVLTDDELVEGRRMLEELVDREVDGRVTVGRDVMDREVVDRETIDREVVDREVVGLDIVDREVVDREVEGREIVDRELEDRDVVGRLDELLLEELRLVVTLLVGRLEELRLEELRLDVTRLDVAALERLDEVDLDDDLAEEEDFVEDELFRLVLLDAAITGSAISARISTKSTKNSGLKEKDRFLVSEFRILYSVFFFSVSIVRLLSSAFTSKLLFHLPIKGKRQHPGNKISAKYEFFSLFLRFEGNICPMILLSLRG